MTLLIEPIKAEAKVLSIIDECEGVKTFRLGVPGGFTFIPGMFVMLNFDDAPKASRAYSISSSPHEKGFVEITLNQVGDFTRRLFSLKSGAVIILRGPYGKWLYTDDIKRAALISGGTGITPFRSMARYVLAKGLPNKLSIFYSAKTPSEFIYGRELEEFSRRGIPVHATITRPQNLKTGEAWEGPTGRIGVDLLRAKLPDFASTHFYMCGPNALIEDLSAGLAAAAIPQTQIHREKWGDYSF